MTPQGRVGLGTSSPAGILMLGGLTVAALDILDAFVFFGLKGITPDKILQSIASGLLGRTAYSGGAPTAALGAFLHFFIASAVVFTYYCLSRFWRDLARRPLVWGPLYGLAVYVVMNHVVIPLSAAKFAPPNLAGLVNGLSIHALGIGLPSALFTRAARARYDR